MIFFYSESVSETYYVIQAFRESEFSFYLTGSRFFGNHTTDSDWDFFTKNALSVRRFLVDYGFKEESSSYRDRVVAVVYKHIKLPIHVQLVHDVNKKILAQHLIKGMGIPLLDISNKDKRRDIWNRALDLVDMIKNDR